MRDLLKRALPVRDSTSAVVAILVVLTLVDFLFLWWRVLLGKDVLLGGDLLTVCCLPWAASGGPHQVHNILVGDPLTQFLPWQGLVAAAFRRGELPLWNPYALQGTPLLANDQSASFSPLTWVALLFSPARGLSLAMLLKMWVAGIGMALYLRILGARGLAQFVGGVAFASSSFMVVWLQWPQSTVACFLPWAFASVEWYLRTGRPLAWVSTAVVVCLQFLAGHAETSVFFGLGLGLYALTRWVVGVRTVTRLLALVAAAAVGTSMAGIQLIPFIAELNVSGIGASRIAAHAGTAHLTLGAIATWLVPNGHGNPAIDGRFGPSPNYAEAVGFAGVGMVVMAIPGLIWQWKRDKSVSLSLIVIAVLAAGMVYGPLTPLVGRLPVFNSSANWRMLVLLCFVVPASGALGVDALVSGNLPVRLPRGAAPLLLVTGALGVCGLVAGGVVLLRIHAGVSTLLPPLPHAYETFWVGMAALALVAALALLAAGGLGGRGRAAATGLAVLALVEATLFAGPYQPQVSPELLPPANALTSWLQTHARDRPIAALDNVLPPETATLYGLYDVRSYDTVLPNRSTLYWSSADPGFADANLTTTFVRPDVRWMAAAGVAYVLAPAGDRLPGMQFVRTLSGVDIDTVPGARPFATASGVWRVAGSEQRAVAEMRQDPLGPPVVESTQRPAPGSSSGGSVEVTGRGAGTTKLLTRSTSPALVTVRESYAAGWEASVDGRTTPVYPADIAFQAVFVPPGVHTIVLEYRPRSVYEGAILSAGGLAALVLIGLLAWLTRPNANWRRLRRRWRREVVPSIPTEKRRQRTGAGSTARGAVRGQTG